MVYYSSAFPDIPAQFSLSLLIAQAIAKTYCVLLQSSHIAAVFPLHCQGLAHALFITFCINMIPISDSNFSGSSLQSMLLLFLY